LNAEADLVWMRRALAEAERGRGFVEPNPLVGAVIVREGQVLGVGHHAVYGGPHGEVVALQAAGGDVRGGTLYVTLEPCCHHGKTPPCTEEVLRSGLARVVAAMKDPFPKVAGRGLAQLRAAGVEVEVGLEEGSARALNAPYLKRVLTGRPYVIAKWAMTLDGKMATGSGDSRWISGPRSRSFVHELRGRVDAILVGIGTVLADDPQLTARPPGPRRAVRVVLDSAGRLPIESRLVRSAHEASTLVAVTGRALDARRTALRAAGCEVLAFPGAERVPILPLLEELGRRGTTNVLVEGGGAVLGSFLDADEVDAVEVFVAPLLEGGTHGFTPARGRGMATMEAAVRLESQEILTIEGDILIRGRLPRPWLRPEPA
jgi:diaminohydroxyphosphoribosylaminopyrimidine deaminase/5-amino-6-(5-phosphoribosylamino)uracil reductase